MPVKINETSHHHRLKAKTNCSSPNLFHVAVTWKNLGFNRHQTRLRQLINITFDGAAITMQPSGNDGN